MGKACSKLSGRELVVGDLIKGVEEIIEEIAGLTVPAEAHEAPTRAIPLTGQKRSLLVGINYCDTEAELHGCVNDVKRMLPVLEKTGFKSDAESQKVLLDEPGAADATKPTRANMLEAIAWLVKGAKPGDALFFHYSGHGGREPAEGTSDGYHETLVPLDYEKAGMLNDNDLFKALVASLPSGCRLTCVLDSCHSAGALNLPFRFVGTEADMKRALAGDAVHMAVSKNWAQDLKKLKDGEGATDLLKDIGAMGLGLWRLKQRTADIEDADSTGYKVEEQQNVGLHVGEVVAFTGCRSDQTSADVGDVAEQFHLKAIGGDSRGSIVIDKQRAAAGKDGAGGALTTALLEAFQEREEGKDLSFLDLLEGIRQDLNSKGFSQVPQVATSLVVDLKQAFALDTAFVPEETNGDESQKHVADYLSAVASHPEGAEMLKAQ